MTFKPSVLIFGVGPRTGTFIADKFAGAGYQVAATGRSVEDGPLSDGYLNVKADLTNPAVVPDVFAKVKAHLGTPPNVVVCNAYSSTKCDGANPFSLHISNLQRDLTVNITSLYAVGAEAIKGFSKLPDNTSKTFIFVGNKQSNHFVVPMLNAAEAFGELLYSCSFYYADERKENGEAVFNDIDGNAHGDFFLQLAEKKDQGPWEATFVKGKGM